MLHEIGIFVHVSGVWELTADLAVNISILRERYLT